MSERVTACAVSIGAPARDQLVSLSILSDRRGILKYPDTGTDMYSRRVCALLMATGVALPVVSPAAAQTVTVLTTADASFPESFSTVRGLRELPDGRVLIADGLGQVLVIVDLDAGTVDTVGRVGGGPREYRMPDRLFALPGDSILLVDLGNGRLTVLDPDLEFGRNLSDHGWFGGGVRFHDPALAAWYRWTGSHLLSAIRWHSTGKCRARLGCSGAVGPGG